MFQSKSSSPASIFVPPRDAAADFKTKFLESTRRGDRQSLLQKYVTRGRYSSRPSMPRAYTYLSLARNPRIILLAPYSLFLTSRPLSSATGMAEARGGTGGRERERDRPISCDADVYRQTKCNRRTAISFVSRTPARGKGVEEGGPGEGARGRKKNRGKR